MDFLGVVQPVSKIEKVRKKKQCNASLFVKEIFFFVRRFLMTFIRFCVFFLFLITCCTSYANENKYVFIGHYGSDGFAKGSFVLEIVGDDL